MLLQPQTAPQGKVPRVKRGPEQGDLHTQPSKEPLELMGRGESTQGKQRLWPEAAGRLGGSQGEAGLATLGT